MNGKHPITELVHEGMQSSRQTHLYAVGDSYVMGAELPDMGEAYAAIMARERGFSFTNDGLGASSHERISRRTMAFVSEWRGHKRDKDLVVLVGYGHPARNEFYMGESSEPVEESKYLRFSAFSDERYQRQGNRAFGYDANRLIADNPDVSQFVLLHNSLSTNKEAQAARALTHVIALESFLKRFEIPYIITNSRWVMQNLRSHAESLVDTHRYYGFQDAAYSMHGWSVVMGHTDFMPGGHPDAVAHRAWAHHLLDVVEQRRLWQP